MMVRGHRALMRLTSADKVDFTRLRQWWQWLSIIEAPRRGQFLAIVSRNGMLEKYVTILNVYIDVLLIVPKRTVSMHN